MNGRVNNRGRRQTLAPYHIKKLIMKKKFKLDEYEVRIIIRALVELRNQLIADGKYTDAVDELLVRICG